MHHKKAMTMEFLMKILLVIVAFMIILAAIKMFASRADVDSGLSICRGSLALKEHSYIGKKVSFLGTDIDATTALAPLLCKTYDLRFPEKKYERKLGKSKKAVMKNIADRIADCWWEFGEGKVDKNVFGRQFFAFTSKNNCFNCFTFTVDEMKDAKYIDTNELLDFMSSEPYTASADDRPFCVGDEGEKPGENCIDKNLPECERKGGICAEDYYVGEYTEFDDWSCPKKEKCFVKNENLLTYMEYIYLSGGNGALFMNKNLGVFSPNEVYSISFESKTQDAMYDVIDGALLVVDAVTFFKGVPIASIAKAGIEAGGKFLIKRVVKEGLEDLTIMEAKGKAKSIAVHEAGQIIAKNKYIRQYAATGVVRYATTGTEAVTNAINSAFNADSTIYVSTLDNVKDYCITQKEVGQK